jgi:hypothetical protein
VLPTRYMVPIRPTPMGTSEVTIASINQCGTSSYGLTRPVARST